MEQLLTILEELKPGVDFEGNKRLIDDGILESLEIITLASSSTTNSILKSRLPTYCPKTSIPPRRFGV